MFELLTSIYTFWGYIDEANTLRKILKVIAKWLSFVKWYWKNPEIQIKYSRLITIEREKEPIERIHQSLISKGKTFGDGFTKTPNRMEFELNNSRLNYRVAVDNLQGNKQNLLFENKYVSFFPIRKFKSLNNITNEFNEVYEIISNPLKITNNNKIIFIEIKEIENSNKEKASFNKFNAQITFKGNKIQITNFSGSEHGELILFFIMKWLTEYRM